MSEVDSNGGVTPSVALELDCRGLNCPLPILRTKKALGGLEGGDVLRMVATDPGSIADMQAFSRRTGNQIVDQSQGEGEFVFLIRKAGGGWHGPGDE